MTFDGLSLATPLLASGDGFRLVSGPLVTIRKAKNRIRLADIQRTVADYFSITIADLQSPRRAREIARPRQIVMALAREFTALSFPEIGRRLGGRDHTTVIYGIGHIGKLIETNAEVANDVAILRRAVGRMS